MRMPRFTSSVRVDDHGPVEQTAAKLYTLLKDKLIGWTVVLLENNTIKIETCEVVVADHVSPPAATGDAVVANSSAGRDDKLLVPLVSVKFVSVTWTNEHEDLGAYILGFLQNM